MRMRPPLVLLLCLVFPFSCASGASLSAGQPRIAPAVVFVQPSSAAVTVEEKNDLLSLKNSLTVAGLRLSEISVADVGSGIAGSELVVLPYAAARELDAARVAALSAAVRGGTNIVLDGPSPLVQALGIRLRRTAIAVERARDRAFPAVLLYWQKTEVRPVIIDGGRQQVLLADEGTAAPLAVSGRCGKGRYIFLSALFDPLSDKGYSRYPFLIERITGIFGCVLPAERKAAAMYFDPGNRNCTGFEQLVPLWRKWGVQRIYAGAWYGAECDYEQLIRLCHENGILVYCWLEPPMISRQFWDAHPEWREKTAYLLDGHVDWRYLMNLADPACREAALAETEALLLRYDWDGADVAELYFDSALGPKDPQHLTPMNDLVRREFAAAHGFDPAALFNPGSPHYWKKDPAGWKQFAAWRRALCNSLKVSYLDMLSKVRGRNRDFEIVITAIDAWMAPHLEDNIAEDTACLLSLQKQYGLTLQVEDEWIFWDGKPERYAQLGEYYRRFVPDVPRLEIDLNVVDNHVEGAGGLPSEKPTGEEIRQVVAHIDASRARPAFYAEDSILEHDFRNIAATLAREAVVTSSGAARREIRTQRMVWVRPGMKGPFLLDGKPWRAGREDEVIVPAGDHTLEAAASRDDGGPRLAYISGELVEARFDGAFLAFTYREDVSSCYAVVSHRPVRILLDGAPFAPPLLSSSSGFSVKLPSGSHAVTIETEAR